MSQLNHLSLGEHTPSPVDSSRSLLMIKGLALRFSTAALISLTGCASDPVVPKAPPRVSRESNESIFISLTLLEENMTLHESELRKIRMDMARLSDSDLANPAVTEAFLQRKRQVESIMRDYYVRCRLRNISIDYFPSPISPEEEQEFLHPNVTDAGRFNTQLSDSIFLLEMRQRDFRIAIHGQIPPECTDQQAVMQFRQTAVGRLEDVERVLQLLNRQLVHSSFR